MNALSASHTRANGRFLLPLRAIWLLLLALIVSLLIVNAPGNAVYARLEYQVQLAREAILTFTSLQTFAVWLVAGRWLVVAVYFTVALLIAWRKWDDWFALMVSAALLTLAWGFVMRSDRNTWFYPELLWSLVPELSFILGLLPVAALVLLFFLFPNGRFVFRWHKWLAAFAILATVLFLHADTFRMDWRALRPFLEQWSWPIWGIILLIALLAAMAGQLHRYHRLATKTERQQMKWVLFGLAGFLSIPLFSWPLEEVGGAWGSLASIGFQLVVAGFLPIAIGFSILRYRLWEVDLLINRTLVFGGLTLLVTAVYILTVGLLSNLFRGGSSPALSVLATGLIAILFNPLRQRLQTAVNRLMYGERDDPVTVLTTLGKRLEETAVPGESLPALVDTIAHTLKLPFVAIVNPGGEMIAAAGSEHLNGHRSFPLVYQSQPVGQLQVALRQAGEKFTHAEERLLRNVARQAGTAVYASQITTDLQRSREQLVTAREEERRRLRRDLHDGLGPQLATIAVKVGAAQNLLSANPTEANNLLLEIKKDSQTAIQEIRRVVHDLRPSALDQLGLVSALQEFVARQGEGQTQFHLHVPDRLPPLPAAVEVAAYRIATEAITNVVRHARATTCQIYLSVADKLILRVTDNGCGLADELQAGVGLTSMQARAEELGGNFHLQSSPGQGTEVTVSLPLTERV